METEEVTEAVRSYLQEETPGEIKIRMTKRLFRGTRKAYVLIEGAHIKIGWVCCRRPTSRSGGSPVGCAGKRRLVGVTAALVLETWRRTAGGRIVAGAAGNGMRRDTTRGPIQGNRRATCAPLERRSAQTATNQAE